MVYRTVDPFIVPEETDKAFEWLERAYRQLDGGLSEMKSDPLLRNLERDPRWNAFLQKMKLPVD